MPSSGQGAPSAGEGTVVKRSYEEIGSVQMISRASFWLLFAWAMFITMSAMAIISQGAPMALETCPGLDMGTVAIIAGLLSICNGVGRILFGISFDRKGRFFTMVAGGAGFIVAVGMLGAALIMHSMALLVVSYVLIGLTYGSVSSTNSAFANLFFGAGTHPANPPIISLNILIASFGPTIAGAVFDAAGSYMAVVVMAVSLVAVGTVAACFIREPSQKATK